MKSYTKTNTAAFEILKCGTQSRNIDGRNPIKSFFQYKTQRVAQAYHKTTLRNIEEFHAIANALSSCSAKLIGDVEDATYAFKLIEKLRVSAQKFTKAEDVRGRWTYMTKVKDVEIYQRALPNSQNNLIFRISCDMNANVTEMVEFLAPNGSEAYQKLESQVFPGCLQASVLKSLSSSNDTKFPRTTIKWQAHRIQSLSPEPVDLCFMEYATLSTDPIPIGFQYFHSLSDNLTSRVISTLSLTEQNLLTGFINNCKRSVVQNGFHLVLPSEKNPNSCHVICSVTIDFPSPLHEEMAQEVAIAYANRLSNIRDQIGREILKRTASDSTVIRSDWSKAFPENSYRKQRFASYDIDLDQFDLQTAPESCSVSRKKASHCSFCHSTFSILKLRKHCRSCSRAICNRCGEKWTYCEQPVRLCLLCLSKVRLHTSNMPEAQDASSRDQFIRQAPEREISLTSTSASKEHVLLENKSKQPVDTDSSIRIASALSYDPDAAIAVHSAYSMLCQDLNNKAPHLMIVSYSLAHDGLIIYEQLKQSVPNETLFMGGSSSDGIFTHKNAVPQGPVFALWGIYDPEGFYSVINADFGVDSVSEGVKKCLAQEYGNVCNGEAADLIWMQTSYNDEAAVMETANDLVDSTLSFLAGCSVRSRSVSCPNCSNQCPDLATAPISESEQESVTPEASALSDALCACVYHPNGPKQYDATQICSWTSINRNVTQRGIAMALCSPSVEIAHAFFTCYEHDAVKPLVVSHCSGKRIDTLNGNPALLELNKACYDLLHDFVGDPCKYDTSCSVVPIHYPLCREQLTQDEEDRMHTTTQFSKYQVIQPECADEEFALCLNAPVRNGEHLRLMTVDVQRIPDQIIGGFTEMMHVGAHRLDRDDIVGCVMSISSNYPRLMNGRIKPIAKAIRKHFRSAAIMGTSSDGQQGLLLCGQESMHANGMITAVLFTNIRKRSQE